MENLPARQAVVRFPQTSQQHTVSTGATNWGGFVDEMRSQGINVPDKHTGTIRYENPNQQGSFMIESVNGDRNHGLPRSNFQAIVSPATSKMG